MDSLMRLAPSEARASWAGRIAARWGASVAAIIDTGKLLIDAKAALPHGEWGAMIERDLPFKRSTAFRLMAIAKDERLQMVPTGQHLPPSWRTLYEISKLDDERFEAKLKNGEIYADMPRKDVAQESRLFAQARDRARVAALEPIAGKFRTLLLDPPWDYFWLSLTGRAGPGYATMTFDEMLALPVPAWADDPSQLVSLRDQQFRRPCPSPDGGVGLCLQDDDHLEETADGLRALFSESDRTSLV